MLRRATLATGLHASALSHLRFAARERAADMQETTEQPTLAPEATDGLAAAALRAEAWAGEPFLHPDEDPAVALAPETARRRALDDALAEIEAGAREPSYDWKIRYALMLGLERVLSERPPRLASGNGAAPPPDRRAGGDADGADRGNPGRARAERQRRRRRRSEARRGGRGGSRRPPGGAGPTSSSFPAEHRGKDPGASRRYRFRHPTASGKTIAAAGFVEAARTLGVLILTHRRLLVSQFHRELTTEGYGDRFEDAILQGQEARSGRTRSPSRPTPGSRATGSDLNPEAYHLVIADEAHTALGEKTSQAIRSFSGADLHRHDRDRAADRQAGLGRLPGLDRRAAARRRRPSRIDRAAALPARSAGRRDLVGADRRRRLRGARPGRGARPQGAQPGGREPLPRALRAHARHRLRRRASSTRTTWPRSSARSGSRPRPSAARRRRCSSPRRWPPTSAARSTS